MTNNMELLSLHFEQVEKGGSTAWIRCLAHAIKGKLGSDTTKVDGEQHHLWSSEGKFLI